MKVDDLSYDLPDASIAQAAIEPRDSARLLDTRDMTDHVFADLPKLLRKGDLVVVNTTKVRRARVQGHKAGTGGLVELLFLGANEDDTWTAMIRPARRIRVGSMIEVAGREIEVVSGPDLGVVRVEVTGGGVDDLLEMWGEMPLPPYFRGHLDDDSRYQTVYANEAGSAAAPTAGLHFTAKVLDGLGHRGIDLASVDLHVGLDTFRPIAVSEIEDHVMHSEWCSVPDETAEKLAATRERGGRVVAVGTTTTRTLESFGRDDGTVESGTMETDIFLRPGSKFRVVDLMITNFHVPGSTLVAMVSGFMGKRWRDSYQHAIDTGYRFLSFGDAMLCERHR